MLAARENLHGLSVGRGTHLGGEDETIELRFRQRIGAVELSGVLRGDHEERLLEGTGDAFDRHLPLPHRLEQR